MACTVCSYSGSCIECEKEDFRNHINHEIENKGVKMAVSSHLCHKCTIEFTEKIDSETIKKANLNVDDKRLHIVFEKMQGEWHEREENKDDEKVSE